MQNNDQDKVAKVNIGPGAYDHEGPEFRANFFKNNTSSFASKKATLDFLVGG